jgi:ABC-type multidrug transport system ATPase subunit
VAGLAGVEVRAHGLGVRGPLGPVFSDVTCAIGAGELAAIAGPGGSGRTSLLLTLAGRMRPGSGRVSVGGHDLPRQAREVRGLVAVAQAGDAVALSDWWRVHETIDHRALLLRRRISPAEVEAVFGRVELNVSPNAYVRELGPLQRTLLAVALASLEGRPALVVDDLDGGVDAAAQRHLWRTLATLADAGTTVLAAAVDVTPADGTVDAIVRLGGARPGAPA